MSRSKGTMCEPCDLLMLSSSHTMLFNYDITERRPAAYLWIERSPDDQRKSWRLCTDCTARWRQTVTNGHKTPPESITSLSQEGAV